jgi:hypothetical protein
MYKTMDEALDALGRELKQFSGWAEKLPYRFIEFPERTDWEEYSPWRPPCHPDGWATEDMEQAKRRNARLKGMAVVLGLTPDEILAVYREAGIRTVK